MAIVELVGPHLEDQGGVATVNRNYLAAGLFRRQNDLRIRFFASTRDGAVTFRALYGAWRFVRFALRPWGFPDIVHLHTSWRGSSIRKLLYAWIARQRGAKVVFHIHPSRFFEFVDKQRIWFRRAIYAGLQHADVILVLTPEMKSLTEDRVPNVNVRVLRNPVDPNTFSPSHEVVRDAAHVVFVGRFAREKGLFDLLEAVQQLRAQGVAVELTLAGGKDEPQVRATLERLRLLEGISIRGWLDRSGVVELLRHCTVLVLPSYTEGLPMVLMEALMCGTPVISCPVGGIPSLVEHGRNGLLVPAGDIAALATAIARLVSSPQFCRTISTNNLADASGFRSESVVRELRLLYGELASAIRKP
jgi:glycosyltransferase involved in cell wall biosynthesis